MTNIRNALMQAAGSASGDPVYVEDVFSTFLYTGSNGVASYVNNIDLSGEGGLVWIKSRGGSARDHRLFDTERGVHKYLSSEGTGAEATSSYSLTAFNNNGFTLGDDVTVNFVQTYTSWSFRKQKGFFDVVTYTGTGSGQAIAHNLGCKPGMILVKLKSASGYSWGVWHKSLAINYALALDTTAAVSTDYGGGGWWNSTAPTATHFSVGTYGIPNTNGEDFVAYLFADGDESAAQIFGDDGDEAIVKCGSFTTDGSAIPSDIDLGFEPQFLLVKRSDSTGAWNLFDTMRGFHGEKVGNNKYLRPNTSNAEANNSSVDGEFITATGFGANGNGVTGSANATFIYLAIRRGPMKEPSAGTEVLGMNGSPGSSDYAQLTTGNLVDVGWQYLNGNGTTIHTRLLGKGYVNPTSTAAVNTSAATEFDYMDGFAPYFANSIGGYTPRQVYGFRRFPKVFDVVAYAGNPSVAENHNLTVSPELIITKEYDHAWDWYSWGSVLGDNKFITLNSDGAATSHTFNSTVTATTFMAGIASSGQKTVAYLFASLDGISKVGTYTGTGNDINVTGLGAAARFVMIKRTDGTGDWYVYDSVRGIVAGNDPFFRLNLTTAQTANTDYIDPHASGFTITSSAPNGLNANGSTYLYLAFA